MTDPESADPRPPEVVTAMGSFVQAPFRKEDDLRTREMAEWDCLLVFTPKRPELHILNTTSWAIMELCRGQSFAQLRADYQEFVGGTVSAEHADRQLVRALRNLERKGIVRRLDAPVSSPQEAGEEVSHV